MSPTKEHYDELVKILEAHEFSPQPEEWNDKHSMIQVEDSSFTIIFDGEDVMISFERSCAPDYVGIVILILLKEFSLRDSLVVMENYYYSHIKEETFFGEEADTAYLDDIYEIAVDDFKEEKKIDFIFKNVDPICKDC